MNELGKRLLSLRLQKGLTISETAREMGVSTSTYREWELGRQIKGEPYEKLAAIFDVSITELLTGRRDELDTYLEQIESTVKSMRALL
jgi:transcriptional regulator with XRE-family HTH domain